MARQLIEKHIPGLIWVSSTELERAEPSQTVQLNGEEMVLLHIGSDKTCTAAFVSNFARKYSLPTLAYTENHQFKRWFGWLKTRNRLIVGFTELNAIYYMVVKQSFQQFYLRFGFCSLCGILRCSPVWCVCGRKNLYDKWTSHNKQLDDLIKKSQRESTTPNDAYLEWIPFENFDAADSETGRYFLYGAEASP